MTELLTQLRSALGSGFEVERELSRGGMSRVFLATERTGDQVADDLLDSAGDATLDCVRHICSLRHR